MDVLSITGLLLAAIAIILGAILKGAGIHALQRVRGRCVIVMVLRDTAFERVVELMNDVEQRFVMHLLVLENVIRRLSAHEPRNRWIDQGRAFESADHALVAGTAEAFDFRSGRPVGPCVRTRRIG